MTWLRAVERLSRSGPSEVADAHLHLRELVGAARALAPVTRAAHTCGGGDCAFADHPDAAALCALVPRLAALDVSVPPDDDPDPDRRVAAFVAALGEAGDTVRWCRQTAHPGGACWFASPHGGDCGDVLKLAHRLG